MSSNTNTPDIKSVTDKESAALIVPTDHSGQCEYDGCDESVAFDVLRDDGFEKQLCAGHTQSVTEFIDEVYQLCQY